MRIMWCVELKLSFGKESLAKKASMKYEMEVNSISYFVYNRLYFG